MELMLKKMYMVKYVDQIKLWNGKFEIGQIKSNMKNIMANKRWEDISTFSGGMPPGPLSRVKKDKFDFCMGEITKMIKESINSDQKE